MLPVSTDKPGWITEGIASKEEFDALPKGREVTAMVRTTHAIYNFARVIRFGNTLLVAYRSQGRKFRTDSIPRSSIILMKTYVN